MFLNVADRRVDLTWAQAEEQGDLHRVPSLLEIREWVHQQAVDVVFGDPSDPLG
jgi:hypothetical protein